MKTRFEQKEVIHTAMLQQVSRFDQVTRLSSLEDCNLIDAAIIARIKRLVKPEMGLFSFQTVWRTRAGDMRG